MLVNLVTRTKKWISVRLPFLSLVLLTIFSSYFPAITRYNINTLFDTEKRGYFSFLFTKLQLKKEKNDLWIRWFAVILLACCVLYMVSRTFLTFCEKQTKSSLAVILNGEFRTGKNTELIKSSSDKLVDEFASFFSCFCELLIDAWAVISINLTRKIKKEIVTRTFICVVVITFWIGLNFIPRNKTSEDKSNFSLFDEVQRQLLFPELNIIFTALYLCFFPVDKEVINAVLLSFNVSSLLSKSKKFIQTIPRVTSTHKVWKEAKIAFSDKKIIG